MKKISVCEKELSKLERIAYLRSSESRLFRDKNVLYKVLRPEYRNGRDSIVSHLHDNEVPNLPLIYNLLIDKNNGDFLGYSMEFLEGFKTLEDSSFDDEYNFLERKEACSSMVDTIEKLILRGYEHYDIHERNVMVKGNKARIIDIDSMGNTILGIVRREHDNDHNSPIAMLNDITNHSLAYLLNRDTFYEQYDYYLHYEELLKEFKGDKIMTAYLSHQLKKLITKGYTPEIILDSINEGHALRLKHVMDKDAK